MVQSLPTELRLADSSQLLGRLYLDWTPEPGAYLLHEDRTYVVLERCHQYHFQGNQYRLQKAVLSVQETCLSGEKSWLNHRWVIGDATCRYNAHSEILRCSVNPLGPCQGCRDYGPR